MPITADIVIIGPKGNRLCYINTKRDVAIEKYLADQLYCEKGITRQDLIDLDLIDEFCVENNCFWAHDAQEC